MTLAELMSCWVDSVSSRLCFPSCTWMRLEKRRHGVYFTATGSLRETSPLQSALVPTSLPQKPSGAGDVSCPAGSPGDPLPVRVVNFCRLVNACHQLNTELHFIQIFWDKANCSRLTSFLFQRQCFSEINAIDKNTLLDYSIVISEVFCFHRNICRSGKPLKMPWPSILKDPPIPWLSLVRMEALTYFHLIAPHSC